MATNNLTKKFFELRKHSKFSGPRPHGYNKIDNSTSVIELDEIKVPMLPIGAPPEWVSTVQQVSLLMNKIKQKMELLKKAHARHLTNQLAESEDALSEEQEIKILSQDITELFQQARSKIKNLATDSESEHRRKNPKKLTDNMQLGNNLRSNLAGQLQDLTVLFRRYQKEYLTRLQEREKRNSQVSKMNIINDEGDENFKVEVTFTQSQKAQVQYSQQLIEEREKQIKEIVKSVKELAQIFNDLSILVYEQGTLIDRIDHNLEITEGYVEEAKNELVKARNYQKKYTNRLCILLLCLVFLMGVIVIIKALFFPTG